MLETGTVGLERHRGKEWADRVRHQVDDAGAHVMAFRVGQQPFGRRLELWLGQGRDWARLHDGKRAICQRPFDVYGHPVQVLDLRTELGQSDGLGIPEGGRLAKRLRDGLFFGAAIHAHGHRLFVGDLAREDRVAGLVDREGIRRHQSTDDRFTQSPRGVDDRLIAPSIERVGGEQNASHLRRNERLHHHSQADALLVDSVLHAVTNRPGRPQAGPAPFDSVQHRCGTLDVEKSLLLPGK